MHNIIPVPPKGTNTCNPIDGGWTERVLPLQHYRRVYAVNGFKPRFYNGFYDTYGKGFKNFIKKIANATLLVFGKYIATYIIIVAGKK